MAKRSVPLFIVGRDHRRKRKYFSKKLEKYLRNSNKSRTFASVKRNKHYKHTKPYRSTVKRMNMTDGKVIVAFHYFGGGGNRSRCEYKAEVKSLQDLMRDDIIVSEDEEGTPLRDEDWTLRDTGGNELLHGRDAIESETGVLDRDGDYDTWVVEHLEDCSEREQSALYEAYRNDEIPSYRDNAEDIMDYAVEMQGLHRVHRVKFYACNADVFTSNGCYSFSWDGLATDEEVMEAWRYFFDDNDFDEKSWEKWERRLDRTYYN